MKFEIRMSTVRSRWKSAKGGSRELNNIFRESLLVVADHWIRTMLPQHFGNDAMQRYGYRFRSERHLRKKAGMRPDLVMPAPFEYTGALKRYVLGNATSGRMLNASKAISTQPSKANPAIEGVSMGGKISVTIPVPFPHPINPKNAGEMTRIIRREWRELRRLFFDEVERRLASSPRIIEHETIKAA